MHCHKHTCARPQAEIHVKTSVPITTDQREPHGMKHNMSLNVRIVEHHCQHGGQQTNPNIFKTQSFSKIRFFRVDGCGGQENPHFVVVTQQPTTNNQQLTTNRQTERQTDKPINRQTDKRTNQQPTTNKQQSAHNKQHTTHNTRSGLTTLRLWTETGGCQPVQCSSQVLQADLVIGFITCRLVRSA